jgi:hypothetical protein
VRSPRIFVFIVIFVAGTLLYFFFIKGEIYSWKNFAETETDSSNKVIMEASDTAGLISETQAGEQLPPASLLVDTETVGATLTATGDGFWLYDSLEKKLKKFNLAGRATEETYTLTNLPQALIWSSDKKSFIYQGLNQQYYYVEPGGDEILLGANLEVPVFSGDGRLWYRQIAPDNQTSYIKFGTPSLGLTDNREVTAAIGSVVLVGVPGNSDVAYYLTPSSRRASAVYRLDSRGGKKVIVGSGPATTAAWSPNGDHLVFTRLGKGDRINLWLATGDGQNARELERSTFIDKIGWNPDGSKLYLAVPKLLPTARSYLEEGGKTEDKLYEIDLVGGDSRLLTDFSDFDEKIDVRDIFLSETGKLLYFRNSYNSSLYAVNLEKI